MIRQKPLDYALLFISLTSYVLLTYGLYRYQTLPLIATYSVLFLCYGWIVLKADKNSLRFWMYTSVLFRLILLPALPNLSDDFYRFIWDGRLLENSVHPFAHIPSFYMEDEHTINGINQQLYDKLNSPHYFTIYPPVAQFVFWLSVKLSPCSILVSVIIMRLLVIVAEVASIWLLQKLVLQFSLPKKNVLLYALNPLVIVELTGNLHLEAFMILFLLLAIYCLSHKKAITGSVAFAFGICTKLLPLLFLPVIVLKLGWRKGALFSIVTVITSTLLFVPLLDVDIIHGFSKSLGYYFNKFEFNASIYYLIREAGYHWYGFNIIEWIGIPLALTSGVLIILFSLMRAYQKPADELLTGKSLAHDFLFILFTYLLFTPVVHPWYITPLLAFSAFTRYRFTVIWTYLIFLTYAGYTKDSFVENSGLVAIEYVIVTGYFLFELYHRKKEYPDEKRTAHNILP